MEEIQEELGKKSMEFEKMLKDYSVKLEKDLDG